MSGPQGGAQFSAASSGAGRRSSIDLHVRQGFTTRTTTYLAVAGRHITRCLTCEKVHPPEGEAAYRLWKAGGVQVEGGPFSKLQLIE